MVFIPNASLVLSHIDMYKTKHNYNEQALCSNEKF